MKAEIVAQINSILKRHSDVRAKSHYEDCSDLPDKETTAIANLLADCIYRFAPQQSLFRQSLDKVLKEVGTNFPTAIPHLVGILLALRTAYENDLLLTVEQIIHADLFSDFLEAADHLLNEGYKDPAAVITGSVLEEHLRKLMSKNGLALEINSKPKKADTMNTELASASVYSKLDQKSITSWLDLRNKAAHGKYQEYVKDQVIIMIQGVRNFMSRVPA